MSKTSGAYRPTKTINRSNYKGKGRPRKVDYIDAKKVVRKKFVDYSLFLGFIAFGIGLALTLV